MGSYDKLVQLMSDNPELTFNNDGYERLAPDVVERNKSAIAEIEAILKECVWGFVSFQNFKPRKDGTTAVRCQVRYSETSGFVGVSYINMTDFKDY